MFQQPVMIYKSNQHNDVDNGIFNSDYNISMHLVILTCNANTYYPI